MRWLIGSVQVRRALFSWQIKTPLSFAASGGVRGLGFTGTGALSFSGSDGGTARFAAKVSIPEVAGASVTGDIVLKVSRRHTFNVQKVHVAVAALTLDRLLFKKLDFQYANNVWSADAAVRLPAFTPSTPTLDGHIEVANGSFRGIAVTGSGLTVPLGEGLVLTKAGLNLHFHPVVIQGTGTAFYGPPIGGNGPLEIDGSLQYSSEAQHWDANGTVSLPWGLPGVKPTVTVALGLDPGRSMTFAGHLDLTVHGFGVTGDLSGFASPRAFNVEGKTTLALTPLKLSGKALISSRGIGACGRVQLKAFGFGVGIGPRLGFGYTWGGSLNLISSSCDVGRFRVVNSERSAPFSAQLTPVDVSSPSEFAVFAAEGDFEVSGPTGTFSSTPDRDTEDSFALHDPSDKKVYLAIPVLQTDALYTVTSPTGAPLGTVEAASGLKATHAGDVTAGVTGSGRNLTLNYGIDASQFEPGETVSFYQGISPTQAGGEPIVEDVLASGTAPFTPEPLGPTDRYVVAVVSIDGRPREEFTVAQFTTTDVPPPTAAVFVRAASPPNGWNVSFLKVQRVALWEVLTTADDGRSDYQELPATATSVSIPAGTAKHATIDVTPVDQFGREGPTYICDTDKLGNCPAG